MLLRLDFKAVQKLLCDELEQFVQPFVEGRLVMMALQRDARKVDRGKGEIAAGIGDLAARIIHIAHDAGSAAHGRHFRLRASGDIVLEVIR